MRLTGPCRHVLEICVVVQDYGAVVPVVTARLQPATTIVRMTAMYSSRSTVSATPARACTASPKVRAAVPDGHSVVCVTR